MTAPHDAATSAPLVSVVVPLWRPDPRMLEEAVRSVLAQDVPAGELTLTLVDNASPDFDVVEFARRFADHSVIPVSAIRHERHHELADSWNACLARANGRWVHLLHQDDLVLPGFYAALRAGMARPDVGAAYCASWFIETDGTRWVPRLVPMRAAGVLDDWVEHVFVRLSIQCAAIVVRRDVYEALGGFDRSLRYALDWDMWRRIAVGHSIWYHPDALACFRRHPASETARLRREGTDLLEVFDVIGRSPVELPPAVAARTMPRARFYAAVRAIENALESLRVPDGVTIARRQLGIARRHTSSPVLLGALAFVMARGVVRALRGRESQT